MVTKEPNLTLKKAREKAGQTQKQVAKLVGVRESTYQNWEAGHTLPYPEHRRRLCEVFNASMEELGLLSGHDNTFSGIITLDDPKKIKEIIFGTLYLRLRSVVDAATYTDQRTAFTQIVEQFDAMNNTPDNQSYQITRRQALVSLATVPFVYPLNLATRQNTLPSTQYELFLKECGASLTACEELYESSEADDLTLAFQCVSRYLVELQSICHSGSRYRQQALELAAHCAILKTLLSKACVGDVAALVFAQEAIRLSRDSGNICLLLSASSKLAWVYLDNNQRKLALNTARDARDLLEKCKNPIPICMRGGTYSTLAIMQARNRLSPDTALKKASEQDPSDQMLYGMDFTRVSAPVERGRTLYYVGKMGDALNAYAQIVNPETLEATMPLQGILPESWRLGTILDMSRASMKGKARDKKEAVRYWKAAIEGAKRLKHESIYLRALAAYDDLEIAFPDEKEVYDLRDHERHW